MGGAFGRKARGLEFSDCRDVFELARDWSKKNSAPNESGALSWVEAMARDPYMDWESTVSLRVCLPSEFAALGLGEAESIHVEATPLAAACFVGLPKTAQALIKAGAHPGAKIEIPARGGSAATEITMTEWARVWSSNEGVRAAEASGSCADVVLSAIEARELQAICAGAPGEKEPVRL